MLHNYLVLGPAGHFLFTFLLCCMIEIWALVKDVVPPYSIKIAGIFFSHNGDSTGTTCLTSAEICPKTIM